MFKGDHSEVFHHGGCSSVHGDLLEIPFDGSSFLTLKLHMKHEGSYVRSEFFILEEENNLYSGKRELFILFQKKSVNIR